MKLFPIGTMVAATNTASIDGISYQMFEPNKSCKSDVTYNILTTRFGNQTMLARKKSQPYLTINYEYDNIYNREYNQISHFIDNIDEALTSFYTPNFEKGITPSDVVSYSATWVVSVDNTRLFSAVANQKANRVFIWDGAGHWKEGLISSIVTNSSLSISLSDNYGNLSATAAKNDGVVYPLYQVYVTSKSLASFKPTTYLNASIGHSHIGGFMQSGNITFSSKYKV